jgi:hypothetical protein
MIARFFRWLFRRKRTTPAIDITNVVAMPSLDRRIKAARKVQ